MTTIYRSVFSTLWITLQASEQLGLISGDYLEDYFGNSGQVSLYHVASDTYYPLVMIEAPLETPGIPHDVFVGQTSLAGLPDGNYQVRGRVRDVVGNYSIIGAVQSPFGDERVVAIPLSILPGSGATYSLPTSGLLVAVGVSVGPGLRMPGSVGGGLKTDMNWSIS